MPCYHPLKAFKIGINPTTGKNKLKIVPYKTEHLELTINGNWVLADSPFTGATAYKTFREYETIPCGRCIGCRLDYSRRWADRCMLEASTSAHNWWLTLTYDDEHLPTSDFLNEDTGECGTSHTLQKKDLQLFFKRLRNAGYSFRYFASGEYGETSARPHYHVLLFSDNLTIPDLTYYKMSGDYVYYNSKMLSDMWCEPMRSGRKSSGSSPTPLGYVVVTKVTWETCAYTARYVVKKLFGKEADFYKKYNLQPEFSAMSTKPAIAKTYFLQHNCDIPEYILFGDENGSREIRMPKYYERLFEALDLPFSSSINDLRKSLEEQRQRFKLAETDLDLLGLLESEEINKISQINSLRRRL